MTSESHAIPTANGADLAATLFPASEPKAVVLIHPATAVTQAFYEAFARYLAGIGLTALTYDYRGTGASRGPSLRGETQFVLKVDEDIRRVGEASLLIADNHGINFLVRDMFRIDKHSRKILDRFL